VIGGLTFSFVVSAASAQEASATVPKAPYTDADADGYLGICNQHGQQITSGNINTKPFAWEVVSSVAAPSAVSGKGRTATLYAYQPIQGLDAGYWSGEQITGTSQYSNPSVPIAVSTDRDLPLSQFLNVFPPKWDGFIELRVYLDAPGVEPDVMNYPALSLSISGDTWQAVGGGSVDCTAGQAESDEQILSATTTSQAGSGAQSSNSSSTGESSSSAGSSSAGGSSAATSGKGSSGSTATSAGAGSSASDAGTASALPASKVSKRSDTGPLVAGAVLALILVSIVSGITIRARRRRASS
jgi:hypothetical protein